MKRESMEMPRRKTGERIGPRRGSRRPRGVHDSKLAGRWPAGGIGKMANNSFAKGVEVGYAVTVNWAAGTALRRAARLSRLKFNRDQWL